MKRIITTLSLVLFTLASGFGQVSENDRIVPVRPVEASRFGTAVASDQTQVVVTSPFNQVAYVFAIENGKWIEKAILPGINKSTDFDGAKGFGSTVAIRENLVAVGAPDATTGGMYAHGQIQLFKNDGKKWKVDQVIRPGQVDMGGSFGQKLVLGDRILVTGAPGFNDRVGRGYVFEFRDGQWKETMLEAPQQNMGAKFGQDVAVSNSLVAITSPGFKVENSPAGAVFLYEPTAEGGWAQRQGISCPENNLYFGKSVALTENYLAVGAREKVYVYERSGNNWKYSYTLSNPDPSLTMDFAKNVTISPDEGYLAIAGDGVAYLYQRTLTGWKLVQTFQEPASNGFGSYNAFHGNLLLLSAPWEEVNGQPAGAIRVVKAPAVVDSPDFK